LWFLYVDESGDLGFDLEHKRSSRYFTVAILALRTHTNHRALINAVKKTTNRKLTPRRKRKRTPKELKGSKVSLAVKEYFFRQVSGLRFAVYSLTLNKQRLSPELQGKKEITYNYLARLILEEIPFERAGTRVSLTFDKRKPGKEIKEFNRYLEKQLRGHLAPNVALDIYHEHSEETPGLQAVDLFSNGIFRKYELGDASWWEVFQGKVVKDVLWLP
jgi:hypothetical protein